MKEPNVLPDCSICGKPARMGDPCDACKAAQARGYVMHTDDVSGSKQFKDWATYHFWSGYRTAQQAILLDRMEETSNIDVGPGPEQV